MKKPRTLILRVWESRPIEKILDMDFSVGVGSLSAEFMRDCTAVMREQNCRYDEAVAAMGLRHSDLRHNEKHNELPYYGNMHICYAEAAI